MSGFDLINMNGRVYDPVSARFLSPDNYVQEPWNSQNFNRYSYCLNNPLRYTDISGEWMGWDDFVAIVVGGVFNLGSNLLQGNVNSFWQGLSLFGVGAVAGEAALYTGGAAPYVSAGVTSVGNDLVNQGFNNGSIDWGQVGSNLVMSEAMAAFTCGLSGSWSGPISSYVSKLGIKSPAVNSMLSQSLVSGSVGATIDGGFTLINGGSGEDIINAALRGGGVGLTSGAVSGFSSGVINSKNSGISPWTGEKIQRHHSFPIFLEGDPGQVLTPMSTSRHHALHREMNQYLRTKTTEWEGVIVDVSPRRGNPGKEIRAHFNYESRFNSVKNFYDQHQIRYYDARWQFYKNNGILYQWRPW